jgi:hypothetical protein
VGKQWRRRLMETKEKKGKPEGRGQMTKGEGERIIKVK